MCRKHFQAGPLVGSEIEKYKIRLRIGHIHVPQIRLSFFIEDGMCFALGIFSKASKEHDTIYLSPVLPHPRRRTESRLQGWRRLRVSISPKSKARPSFPRRLNSVCWVIRGRHRFGYFRLTSFSFHGAPGRREQSSRTVL